MKKIMSLTIAVLLLLTVTGCKDNTKKETKEDIMKQYASTFYNAHVKGTQGLTNLKVTIKQLKDSAGRVSETYDMTKLEGCTDESYVELTIDPTTSEISNYAFYMNCAQ